MRDSDVMDVGSAQGTFLACTAIVRARRLPSVWFRFQDALRSIN